MAPLRASCIGVQPFSSLAFSILSALEVFSSNHTIGLLGGGGGREGGRGGEGEGEGGREGDDAYTQCCMDHGKLVRLTHSHV